MRKTLVCVVVLLAFAAVARAQLAPWRVTWTQPDESPTQALGSEYTIVVDSATRLVLLGVSCTTVNGATECQAPAPDVTACKTSLVLQARNPFGAASSAPVSCKAPGQPLNFRFTITVQIGD